MKLIAANWKMQLSDNKAIKLALAFSKMSETKEAIVVVCPSFPALPLVQKAIKRSKIFLGAQDLFWQEKGAYTGEVSGKELSELGVDYVIIGHSERRALGESDQMINKKVIACLQDKMIPIICVGENLSERQKKMTKQIIVRQIKAALKKLHTRAKETIIVAYEPIWAIGSGHEDGLEDLEKVSQLIRSTVKRAVVGIKDRQIKILYGGSVNTKNAKIYLSSPLVDGLLVGGASLRVASFRGILKAAAKSA